MRHCVKEGASLFHPKVRWGEDGIFNASAGVGGKACPTGRVESIHCFHQADGADGNKVVLIAGQGIVFFYDVCHQTQIVPDQLFPCGRVTGIATMVEPFSEEYNTHAAFKKIPLDALKKLPSPMNLICVTPTRIDALFSDFKKDGYSVRQVLHQLA